MPRVHDGFYEARAFCTSAMAGTASVLTPRNSELIFIVYFGLLLFNQFFCVRFFFFEEFSIDSALALTVTAPLFLPLFRSPAARSLGLSPFSRLCRVLRLTVVGSLPSFAPSLFCVAWPSEPFTALCIPKKAE